MREYATFLIFPILAVFIFVSYQNWGKSEIFPVDFIDKESLAIEERNYAGPGFKHWNRSHIFAFIHIGKSGGTSFDLTMDKLVQSFSTRRSTMYVGSV